MGSWPHVCVFFSFLERFQKLRSHFTCVPMLLSLLSPSATILLSIVLCTVVSHGQAETRRVALRRGGSLERSGAQTFTSPTSLRPRVSISPYFIGPDWVVDHHDFSCMLPIGTAAAVLQDFYEDLAEFAATTLSPASNEYQLWFGQIMLEIRAQPTMIVEWIMVQRFAVDMLSLTTRGYTNTYQINFIHRPTGKMITFSLYTGLLRAMAGSIP